MTTKNFVTKPAVLEAFVEFTTNLEGCIPWIYLDIKGLATVGLGCLIEPAAQAQALPFVWRGTDRRATPDEITRDWVTIKRNRMLAHLGAGRARAYTNLELLPDGIEALAFHRLKLHEDYFVAHTFAAFSEYPADVQLGIHSMSWAMGCGFGPRFPKFVKRAINLNWEGCAAECRIKAIGNPGLVPRNHANVRLFNAAAASKKLSDYDPAKLYGWP
jgi:GH24 family phage-related lysozyme (muramidase)